MLVKHMVILDLDGQDIWLRYSKCCNGFSVHLVYTSSDSADLVGKCQKVVAYKDAMDDHRPSKHKAMAQLYNTRAPSQTVGFETWKWIQCFIATMKTTFGLDAPLLPSLWHFKEILNGDIMFQQHHANN